MSSTNKTANYQLSQFVGTDIPSILNDYNGDMRKIDSAIKETSVAGGDNATAIAELQATTGRLSTEVGGINATVNSVSGRVLGIEDKIPANASSENKLITAEDIPEIPSIEGLQQSVADLQEEVSDMSGDVKAIQLCVPASASEDNKFVTAIPFNNLKDRVDESAERTDDALARIVALEGSTGIISIYHSVESGGSTITEFENAINAYKNKIVEAGTTFSLASMIGLKIELYTNGIYCQLECNEIEKPDSVVFHGLSCSGTSKISEIFVSAEFDRSNNYQLISLDTYLWERTTTNVTSVKNPASVMDNAIIDAYAVL